MKNFIGYIIGILAAGSLVIILLLTSVQVVAFNLEYYRSEYRKLDRPAAIGMTEKDLMSTTRELLYYLKDQRKDLNIEAVVKGQMRPVFDERERMHMEDVKVLFIKGFGLRNSAIVVLAVSIIILGLFFRKRLWKIVSRSFIYVSAVSLGLILILIILLNMDFTKYFDQFHYIFFRNDLWQLDPSREILIQMVPEPFFFHTAFRIILLFIGSMAVLAGGSWYYLRSQKPKG